MHLHQRGRRGVRAGCASRARLWCIGGEEPRRQLQRGAQHHRAGGAAGGEVKHSSRTRARAPARGLPAQRGKTAACVRWRRGPAGARRRTDPACASADSAACDAMLRSEGGKPPVCATSVTSYDHALVASRTLLLYLVSAEVRKRDEAVSGGRGRSRQPSRASTHVRGLVRRSGASNAPAPQLERARSGVGGRAWAAAGLTASTVPRARS